MATSTSPRAPTNSSSAPRPLPAKLRRQSTFERPPPAPTAVPQPLTPTLLSRSASRSRSTPPQHTLLPSSSSLGESIFQSLSFGFTSSKADPSSRRAPPTRSSTMLANVLESPIQLEPQPDPMMDTHQSTYTYGTSRRRVTSPDTTLPGLARAASPHANSNDAHLRLGNSSPRSPPLPFGDAHPRKAKSALRLSRLRPGSIRDDATLSSAADPVPGTPPAAVMVGERPLSTRVASRRPGSAGSVAPRSLIRRAEKDTSWTDDERQSAATGGRTRGMRVRASSEFTRPVLHMSSVLRESDEVPPSPRHAECRPQYAELRPALLGSSGSRLSPVPVSPGVQSTWSKKSDQSALADDSDIDADVPTTPSATRNDRLGSTSGSSVKQDEPATATPTGTFSVPLSDPASRTQAREDADRRRRQEILREREERARQAGYFVLKGPAKDRCHAFSASEAPYPLSYSPRVLNHQILDNELSRYMRSAMTYHDFKEHPAKVLDLGCGTGHWILSAAQEWPKTHFVGFDLVPIQPSLERVTSRAGATIGGSKHLDLALNERIRWVHGNFLEGLPFEDGEFDFVRCRKIARGVPEAKWDGLYEEIVRVMKPGGAFEHIEEDIVFPAEISAKPTHSPLATFPTPSPSRGPPAPPYLSSSLPAGARSSVIRPPDQYRRSPSTSFSSAIESPVEGRNGLPSAASTTSSASLVPTSTVATSFQPPSSVPSSGSGTNLAVPVPTAPSFSESVSSIPNKDSRGSGDSVERAPRLPQAQDFSFYDPRVHAKLEDLFSSMHEARWINLKPLSLIPRLIQEHFVKMASAPPLNINLPPRPRDNWIQPRMVDIKAVIRVSGDALTQFIKARVEQALEQPNPNPALEGFKNLDPQPGDEEVGRYMSFDFLRMGNVSKSQGLPLFPAAHFQFDLSHLPMVLSSAASDVIACKEAMWEHLKEQEPGFDRREYDAMVRQYQTDMQDRIGMSTTLRQRLGWGPPESDFMRTADQRAFEENYVRAVTLDQADPSGSQRQPRLMRRLRAFIAWKAAE